MSGLLGLSLLYLSWFEYVFKEAGVIPAIAKWKHPESTWRAVVALELSSLVYLGFLETQELVMFCRNLLRCCSC